MDPSLTGLNAAQDGYHKVHQRESNSTFVPPDPKTESEQQRMQEWTNKHYGDAASQQQTPQQRAKRQHSQTQEVIPSTKSHGNPSQQFSPPSSVMQPMQPQSANQRQRRSQTEEVVPMNQNPLQRANAFNVNMSSSPSTRSAASRQQHAQTQENVHANNRSNAFQMKVATAASPRARQQHAQTQDEVMMANPIHKAASPPARPLPAPNQQQQPAQHPLQQAMRGKPRYHESMPSAIHQKAAAGNTESEAITRVNTMPLRSNNVRDLGFVYSPHRGPTSPPPGPIEEVNAIDMHPLRQQTMPAMHAQYVPPQNMVNVDADNNVELGHIEPLIAKEWQSRPSNTSKAGGSISKHGKKNTFREPLLDDDIDYEMGKGRISTISKQSKGKCCVIL